MVALSGLENILRFGSVDGGAGTNPYAVQIEECYGLDKIEFLQSHENLDIYKKVLLTILARQLIGLCISLDNYDYAIIWVSLP